jgi:hypothetical protein
MGTREPTAELAWIESIMQRPRDETMTPPYRTIVAWIAVRVPISDKDEGGRDALPLPYA